MEAYAAEHDVPIVGPGRRVAARDPGALDRRRPRLRDGQRDRLLDGVFRARGRPRRPGLLHRRRSRQRRAGARLPGAHGICRPRDDQGRRRGGVARADDRLLRRHLHRRGQGGLPGRAEGGGAARAARGIPPRRQRSLVGQGRRPARCRTTATEGIRHFNQTLFALQEFRSVIVPLRDGVAIARREN